MKRLPLWLKVAFTLFMAAWVPTYAVYLGPRNFLWLCDLCNFILLIALWTENRLLLSSQIVSVLLVDLCWTVDVAVAVSFGFHPIGGTEYMLNPEFPLPIRLFSLYHVAIPVILCWGVWKLGYDRRGILLQTALTWVVLPLSFVFSTPEWDINWVYGLFGKPQSTLHPGLYFALHMLLYPVVVYLPAHGILLGLRKVIGRP